MSSCAHLPPGPFGSVRRFGLGSRACAIARIRLPRFLAFLSIALAPHPAVAQTQAISVVLPERAPVVERLRLSGTLGAERSARLSTRVDGLVAKVLVDAGDEVAAGAPLLELDATLAQLALARSRANRLESEAALAEAERLLEEGQRLSTDNHIPLSDLATRRASVSLAEAALAAARAAEREQAEIVDRHVLPAPFAGVIVNKQTEAGEWIPRGTAVFDLVAVDRVRLDVQAPQERYADIDPGSPVTVQPDTRPDVNLPARIVARVPVAGSATARSFLIRIIIEDAEHQLLPGTSATATIPLRAARRADVLRIPRDALLRHPDGGFSLYVVEAQDPPIVRRRPVSIGREGDGRVEIVAGLAADERVVIRGNETLNDGQAVRIVGD